LSQFYLDHYGFAVRPFSILPDPDMLFWSDRHRKAFAVLEYGMMTRAPLTVVTGEVGAGKTTLIQALLRRADGSQRIGLISNARGDRGDLLRWILNAFDIAVPPGADYVDMFQVFQDFVLAEYAAGRLVVLIFDEAQNLGADTLEELRMLTNINSGTDELLQLILLGQPELRDIITRPELRQFAQRVSATFHLGSFDTETSLAYMRHRLQKAGGTGLEIDNAAMARIHAEARGVPRMINKIADLALVYGAAADRHVLGADIVDELIRDGLILTAAPEPTLPEPALPGPTLPDRPARLVLAHEQEVKRDAT
jgi:general secretion pathway protein A